jgi:hypothetical protein
MTAQTRTATTRRQRPARKVKKKKKIKKKKKKKKKNFFVNLAFFCHFKGGAGKHNWGTPEDERTAPTVLDNGVSFTLYIVFVERVGVVATSFRALF